MTLIDKAEALAVLQKAQVASCTCQIKTPDPEWHSHNCRYRILREAEAMIDHLPDAALHARGVGVKPDRATFDAMCAMRNSINEYIPMPSLESDLLQGPENSVFCATVASAVIAEVSRLRGIISGTVVKQLEWHNFDAWTHWAEGACGTYHVEERNGYWQVELRVGGLVHGVTQTDDTTPADLDAAKAAAQADYEARILAALAPTDAAQARETHLREAAAAVRARYMGDNNREDQEVLRCEAAILALIDKPASAAQAREAALHDRITEALVAAQERAHRAYEQDAPFDPNEHKVRISVKDTYAILALIEERT